MLTGMHPNSVKVVRYFPGRTDMKCVHKQSADKQPGWQFWTLDANSPVFPGRFPVQVLTRSPSPGPDELPRTAWPTRVEFIGISIGWKSAFRGFFLHVRALSSISYMAAWCMSCGVRMRISFAVTYNMIQSKDDGYFSNFCLLKMEITTKT